MFWYTGQTFLSNCKIRSKRRALYTSVHGVTYRYDVLRAFEKDVLLVYVSVVPFYRVSSGRSLIDRTSPRFCVDNALEQDDGSLSSFKNILMERKSVIVKITWHACV